MGCWGTQSMGSVRSSSEYSSQVPSRMEVESLGHTEEQALVQELEGWVYRHWRARHILVTGSSPGGGSRDYTTRSGPTAPTSVSASALSFAFGL